MTAGDQRVGAAGGNKSIGNRPFSLSVLEPMDWHEGTGCRLPASTCEQRIHAHTDAHRKSLCDHGGFCGRQPIEECVNQAADRGENKCVHCAVFQRRWQSDRRPVLAAEIFASRGMLGLILDRRGWSDFAAARVCGLSGGGRTQKGGMQALRVCVCHATTSQQTCCDSVTLTSLWSSRAAEARPTPMHLVDGVRHLSRRCREHDVLTQPQRAWSVTMAQSAVAGGIFTSRRQQRERESCSCCWRCCCLLWPPMPIIVCPLIMGGVPPLVTSSAGISQQQ
ncbi:hypothetical protein TCSYLVIO_005165 [Trypanosoma cruzi]|nr:hypothetical protein TCSYLVIO_005165 [Trypanosoma cruzi]